ncbi:MAG: hypothetical protein ACLQBL_19620 [Polyangiaceae bacterium]
MTRVALTISDPWELVTACGSGPFEGTVLDVESSRILVSLDAPLSYEGESFRIAICQTRQKGTTVETLLSTHDTPTGVMLLPGPRATIGQVSNEDRRKSAALIGSLRGL